MVSNLLILFVGSLFSNSKYICIQNYASKKFGVEVLTYVPVDVSGSKEARLLEAGIKLVKYSNDCMAAQVKARQEAQVSP